MNKRTLLAANLALFVFLGLVAQAADAPTRYFAKTGSKMRIEGTANMIHTHWAVESPIIGGFLEAGANFPTEPGQAVPLGKVEAKAEPFISTRSLKSVEDDGKPYSDSMDDIMYDKMRVDTTGAKILFHLTELVLKEAPKSKEEPYLMEASGDLTVAGVTNKITMPVKILPQADKKLKVSGTVAVKMSDYKIESPAPKVALGMLKTGDEVKLSFEWNLQQRATSPATSATPAAPAAK